MHYFRANNAQLELKKSLIPTLPLTTPSTKGFKNAVVRFLQAQLGTPEMKFFSEFLPGVIVHLLMPKSRKLA